MLFFVIVDIFVGAIIKIMWNRKKIFIDSMIAYLENPE